MKFYTKQHRYYCGIDLHARSKYVCILDLSFISRVRLEAPFSGDRHPTKGRIVVL